MSETRHCHVKYHVFVKVTNILGALRELKNIECLYRIHVPPLFMCYRIYVS